MAVRPWSIEDLGKVSRPFQAAFDLATRRLGLPGRSGVVSLLALGDVTIACGRVGPPAAPGPGDALWAVERYPPEPVDPASRVDSAADRGFLIVDALACLGLVSVTLGLPAPKIHRPPTPIELGIVAATLGGLLRRADPSLTVNLEPVTWPGSGQALGDLVEVELQVSCSAFRERVRVQVPPSWIPSCPIVARCAGLLAAEIPIRLPIELGRTTLCLGDWSAATVGDAVVFDGVPPADSAAPWAVTLRCDRYAASALWEPRGAGRLGLVSDFCPTIERRSADTLFPPHLPSMHVNERTPHMADDEKLARLSMLASAPLEVVAEVGEVVMRADALIALQKGSVISLRRPRSTLVELKIADRVWARGELVDVDGELGVRITELTAPEPASTASAPEPSTPEG